MPTLAQIPKCKRIPAMMGELAELVAEENRKHDGPYSLAYYRGKWVELTYWNGCTMEVILPKDTRVTGGALTKAIRAVKELAGQ